MISRKFLRTISEAIEAIIQGKGKSWLKSERSSLTVVIFRIPFDEIVLIHLLLIWSSIFLKINVIEKERLQRGNPGKCRNCGFVKVCSWKI